MTMLWLMLFFVMNINSGIANTMDLPEKLLPRIASRMGMQRLCFGPYNYQQLQEIISSRLKGIDAFEKQAIEFASRKVSIFLFIFIFFIMELNCLYNFSSAKLVACDKHSNLRLFYLFNFSNFSNSILTFCTYL